MKVSSIASAIGAFLCLSLSCFSVGAQQAPAADRPVFLNQSSQSEEAEARIEALRAAARQRGTIEIIVGLDAPISPPEVVGAASHRGQKARFQDAATALAARVYGGRPSSRVFRPFEFIPYVVMTVTAAELDEVLGDPAVTNVQLNSPANLTPRLVDVVEIIDATYLWERKRVRKGNGQTIAVLDNGLDRNLPSFGGRIVQEACFSEKSKECVVDEEGNTDFESSGPGAAWQCKESAQIWAKKNRKLIKKGKDPEYCFGHGTKVASIALARSAKIFNGIRAYDGVAPKADLVAIRIQNRGSTYASITKGIEYVYKKRKKFGITVATMSVGLLDFRSDEECSGRFPSMEAVIELLLGAGIPFFNSSGNDYSDRFIDYPGCLDTVSSVGASKYNDTYITQFSDINHLVAMLAPGQSTRFYQKGSGESGTSFAAPAVAGGYALLKAANEKKKAEEIVTAMHCTGKPLTKVDFDIAVPRLDLKAAHRFLNIKKPGMSWHFDEEGDALGWYEMWGDWQVTGDSYSIGPDEKIWVSFILNELCFEDFRFDARIRSESTDPQGHGIVLFEEPKRTDDDPESRTFSGFYWYLYNGYTSLLAITDNKFNVDENVSRQGPAESLCNGHTDVEGGEYVTQTLRLKKGRLQLSVNGEEVCDIEVGDVDLRSYGVFAFRRKNLDEPVGVTHVDYIKIKGL